MPPDPTRGDDLRLRAVAADEYVELALPWYRDPVVLDLSEQGAAPYDRPMLRRMFEVMASKGEVYVIELRDGDEWRAIGDASLLSDATPIVIGDPAARARGHGTRVLGLLVDRARELRWRAMNVDGVSVRNEAALRLYRRAGFVETDRHVDERGDELVSMRLALG